MKYNSVYTPKFNPIEHMFNKSKIEFKKLPHDNLIEDIKISLNKISSLEQFYNNVQKNLNKYNHKLIQ